MSKVISPLGLNLLADALTNVYWRKEPHKKFISRVLKSHNLDIYVDWSLRKREISDAVINKLSSDQSLYFEVLSSFIEELCKFDDFSHLKIEEDAAKKIDEAKRSVESLKKFAATHIKHKAEKQVSETRKKALADRINQVNTFNAGLDKLKRDFFDLQSLTPHARGLKFEPFLRQLFSHFDLDPKSSFKTEGEQIDGAFSFEGGEYLLEAKWEKQPISAAEIRNFAGKITARLDNTLGLMISMSGFSEEALTAIKSDGRKVCILADGQDLYMVLEGRISLEDLIIKKKRHAAQTGEAYLPVSKIV